ncbi:hypothetical protein [Rheinheimera sp.]|jgi:hypothetical protein|uniref:hypothetical protein n=1 Tax=Rheinheimera sp. TaxID=1869214 RepID=UPI0040488221
MARNWLVNVLFFGLSCAVSPTWALDISSCIVSFMRPDGGVFLSTVKGGAVGGIYKKQWPKPTRQCLEIGVHSVVVGTEGDRVLYAELKWAPAPGLRMFETLPDRIQGAISAQRSRAADNEAQHLINLPGLPAETFRYGLHGEMGAYVESVYWGVDIEGTLNEK